jgi:NAD(P)H-dependent flavin oxidoreductase YrpB (nitropropane dioxygenase family)
LSQAISEGDGISLIATVRSAEGARAAEDAGAEGLILTAAEAGVSEETGLPILWRGGSPEAAASGGADAWVVVLAEADDDEGSLEALHGRLNELGLELVVEVRDEEEVELALERLDPEIFLLSGGAGDADEEPLDRVLALLPDVPAGKLAIAATPATSREDVVALERAGVDGVLVDEELVASLVGGQQPPHV